MRSYWGYLTTLEFKMHTKDNTWNVIFFTIVQEIFAKLGGQRFAFIMKRMYSLVNLEN